MNPPTGSTFANYSLKRLKNTPENYMTVLQKGGFSFLKSTFYCNPNTQHRGLQIFGLYTLIPSHAITYSTFYSSGAHSIYVYITVPCETFWAVLGEHKMTGHNDSCFHGNSCLALFQGCLDVSAGYAEYMWLSSWSHGVYASDQCMHMQICWKLLWHE